LTGAAAPCADRSRTLPIALVDELGFAFRQPELVRQALTHRSFGTPHNERLEFIGDAVLGCVIAEALFERFPSLPEGKLTRLRANLVNGETLARLALETSLPKEIRLGDAMLKSGQVGRSAILANALEAVFGAVFVDGGYEAARAAILRVYAAAWAGLDPAALSKDAKTRLQEWLQARRMPVPEYAVTALAGEAHAQTITIECRIPALGITATADGPSRRAAEQAAAEHAYAAAIAQSGAERRG